MELSTAQMIAYVCTLASPIFVFAGVGLAKLRS